MVLHIKWQTEKTGRPLANEMVYYFNFIPCLFIRLRRTYLETAQTSLHSTCLPNPVSFRYFCPACQRFLTKLRWFCSLYPVFLWIMRFTKMFYTVFAKILKETLYTLVFQRRYPLRHAGYNLQRQLCIRLVYQIQLPSDIFVQRFKAFGQSFYGFVHCIQCFCRQSDI